jgi:hypothetical protein
MLRIHRPLLNRYQQLLHTNDEVILEQQRIFQERHAQLEKTRGVMLAAKSKVSQLEDQVFEAERGTEEAQVRILRE